MNETEFNLIDEPWIRVIDERCELCEISLKEAIINAHKYKALKGELPTQDVAVMRLILAVLHTVISRYDKDGNASQLECSQKAAVKRWKSYWDNKRFPQKAVEEYLEKWYERFWLFHPERPFFQVANLKEGTKNSSAKLNGEISQSNNKIRIFSSYSGEEKKTISYSQAVRWLLHINGFDDIALKKYTEEKISAKRGWLGQLGLIDLIGRNLFETLMLNMVMVIDGAVQHDQNPIWEHEVISSKERNLLAGIPNDLAELYTVQFRRILLQRDNNRVISYIEVVGDIFPDNVVIFEPMTVRMEVGKTEKTIVPKKHDPSMQMWRNFASLYNFANDDKVKSGVIKWFYDISGFLPDVNYITTKISSVMYDEKQGASLPIINVFSDSLTMHSSILAEIGEALRCDIELEIERCQELADEILELAKNLYIADGGSKDKKEQPWKDAAEQLYYRLDMPFRKWLYDIDPDSDENEIKAKWHKTARSIAIGYARELVNNASETAFVGRCIGEKKSKKIYSAPKAYSIFKSQVYKIYGKAGDK